MNESKILNFSILVILAHVMVKLFQTLPFKPVGSEFGLL